MVLSQETNQCRKSEFEIDSHHLDIGDERYHVPVQQHRVISALYGIEGDSYNWREAKVGTGYHGLQPRR